MDGQKRLALSVVLATVGTAMAADPDGAALYRQHCASCHDASAVTRAPAPAALRLMSAENIVRSLESGAMKAQGERLTGAERQALAGFLVARTTGTPPPAEGGQCAAQPEFSLSGPAWNGWSPDPANTRFQPEKTAGLTAAEVPKLKLKWAFAFPNTFTANGQPTVAGGRVFVASANRKVYSLDAQTGCQYWSFE